MEKNLFLVEIKKPAEKANSSPSHKALDRRTRVSKPSASFLGKGKTSKMLIGTKHLNGERGGGVASDSPEMFLFLTCGTES